MANVVTLTPIATVITPATLTAETKTAPPSFLNTTVPMVDSGSLNSAFFSPTTVLELSGGDIDVTHYGGPQFSVTKTVVDTAALGRDFFGPATRCTPMADPLEQDIINQAGAFDQERSEQEDKLGILGWTPNNGNLPFLSNITESKADVIALI